MRTALAERGLLDHGHEICVDDGWLYVPVANPAVIEAYEITDRDLATRRTQRTPADILGFEPTYERLGDVVLLTEDDPERAREVADAVMASDLPVTTVVRRASKVKGQHRTRDWELLVGEDTETVYREYGCEYLLDVREVYFSPRLATDRHLVAQQVNDRVGDGEQVIDMFAGVGPFVIPFAKRGAEAVGVDLNPAAIAYLRENARRNGVADRVTAIEGDVRAVAAEYDGWADRLVMNLPHSAGDFLDTATRLASDDCVLHYYDIAHDADPFGPGERAIRTVAKEAGYEATIETRRRVRSYAPHELNVRLDARLRRG